MELPELGQQCDVETCRQLDFLPIACKQCGGSFCKDHSLSLYHRCVEEEEEKKKKEEEEEEGKEGDDRKITRHPCQFPKCEDGELTPVLCPGCGLNYCLAHRHQADHQCPHQPQQGPSEQEKAAAEKIKQIADKMEGGGGGGGGEKRRKGKKSEQLAAKVQLMKLKQKAEGEKGIPQEDRIYLLITLPKSSSSSSSSSSMPVFLSRTWSIGRAIDAIATIAKLKNQNNITGAPKLRLFSPSSGDLLGTTERLLSDLVAGQELFNGQSVVLECVSEGTTHL